MEKKVISAETKKYLVFDSGNDELASFADLYLNFKKMQIGKIKELEAMKRIRKEWHNVKIIEKDARFAGTGYWIYEFEGKRFKVTGTPVKSHYLGTDYIIETLNGDNKSNTNTENVINNIKQPEVQVKVTIHPEALVKTIIQPETQVKATIHPEAQVEDIDQFEFEAEEEIEIGKSDLEYIVGTELDLRNNAKGMLENWGLSHMIARANV